MIDLERQGDVFVLRMNAGENRFSPGVLDAIHFVLGVPPMLIGSEPGDEGEIPTDGFNSLNVGMGVLPATPRNFAGEVPEPGAGLASGAALGTLIALSRTRPRRSR